MPIFKDGVRWYTKAKTTVQVGFPEGDIKCQWCPFCRAEKELGRYWCRLTNKMLYEPYVLGLPEFCPLKLEKNSESEGK